MLRKMSELRGKLACTCAIVQGELVLMALLSERTAENLARLREFLDRMDVLAVDDRVADAYGSIRAVLVAHFGPKERGRRKSVPLAKLGFPDNDVWIAAVAIAQDLTVVSSDSDFFRMAEVIDLNVEDWLGEEPLV
jgi:tRNA(fMet)-specific endonuclease VapC